MQKKNLDMQDNQGKTALHMASAKEKRKVVKFLMLNGASKLIQDNEGQYPADLTSGNPDIIKLLVRYK